MSLTLDTNTNTSTNLFSQGYTCACGAWVAHGTLHTCTNWIQWNYPTTYYPTYTYTTTPSVSRFKGAVKTLDDLPANANTGDAYFVEKPGLLVVRATGGWFQYDKDKQGN